ncbi:MAG: SusC/RagA family TonB-linked outer membrane protein [Bacteroidetes bacterium]|nr:SusC/RagA family TonB-linked outer membrane protein [Bacteroidota bacterium]
MRILWIVVLCVATRLIAQNGIVQGTILNEREEPLGNALVVAEPGSISTYTDASGKFTLQNIPQGKVTITASFVGYESASDEVENESGNDRLVIFLGLRPKTNNLKEVIIVGYARQIKKDVIGNISKVRGNELTANPGLSFDATLQGKAPGIQVIQSGGVAGAGALIRVRGIASVSANGEPLIVLDGLPINQDQFIQIGLSGNGQQNNPISFLNVADIESVDIFKDAAAAGIYGSRGANGVVYITTKRHSKDAPGKLIFSSSIGTSNPTVKLPLAGSTAWLSMYQEAWQNDGNSGKAKLPDGISWNQAENTSTDWVKALTHTGLKTETNASYSFQSGKWRLYNSLGYLNAGSYMIGSNFRRTSARMNGNADLGKRTRFHFGLNLTESRNNRQSQGAQGGLGAAYSVALPIYSLERETGFGEAGNPLLRRKYQDWHTDEVRFLANLGLETEIARNLIWELRGNYDRQDLKDNLFIDKAFQAKDRIPAAQRKSLSQLRSYVSDNYLANTNLIYYIRKSSHTDFNILLGSEYQSQVYEIFQENRNGMDRALTAADAASAPKTWEAWSFLSFFSRVNAKIGDRWLMQASYRMDGSSRFGSNNRFGQFPSAALGYLMSEEPWMKNSKVFSFLKLRTGWGYIGSSAIPNFIRYGTYGPPANGNIYNNQQILQPLTLANPNLKWEMCRVADAGIEMALFKNRIYLEASYYNRLTRDVLLDSRIPSSSGVVNPNGDYRYFQNVGSVSNNGFEFLLNAQIIDKLSKSSRAGWSIKFNCMANRNKVLDMGFTDPDAIVGGGETRILNGQPMGVFYLVRYSHVDKATGKPVFLDKNGKQTFEYNLANRVVAGNVQPKLIGFLENRFDKGAWSLAFSFYGVFGGKLYDEAAKRQLTMLGNSNVLTDLEDRWQKPGDDARYPRLTLSPLTYGNLDNINNYHSTQWLYDGSYIRLRELSLRYKFRNEHNNNGRKLKLGSITLSGFNLWLFSRYPGDPEVIRDYSLAASRNISPNVTNLSAPQERSFMLTLRLEL